MDEPIAIVGLDARLPGDADTAEAFYEFLLAGRSARTDVPPERYNADAFWHPDPERSGGVRLIAKSLPIAKLIDDSLECVLVTFSRAVSRLSMPLSSKSRPRRRAAWILNSVAC